jgi:hypothetical protein
VGTVTDRELNRWTLARQHLLARSALPPAAAIEALAGMQAQSPGAPYIGLWSRLDRFHLGDLEDALRTGTVVKTTVMRGTLHLLAASRLAAFRLATGSSYYDATRRLLAGQGVDLDAIRAAVVAEVRQRPRSRTDVYRLIAAQIPEPHPPWLTDRPSAVAAVSVTTDLVNSPEDALFAAPSRSRYQVLLTEPPTAGEAARQVAHDYLAAYGPATAADLAAWSGRPARDFAEALAGLDLVRFRSDDGRTLLDLAQARRPAVETATPVRFLPRWDSLLLAHVRRERVLAPEHRKLVIAANGDVAPTFLVDGQVAGTWDVPGTGRSKRGQDGGVTLRLRALRDLRIVERRAVEDEASRLLTWLRPEADAASVSWG